MQHRFLSIISFTLLLLLLSYSQVYSQVKNKKDRYIIFSLGMGVDYGATPSYTDYVKNEVPYSTGDSIKTFSAGIEFFGGVEYEFTRTISAKVDYSYYIRSNNYSFGIYVFDYTITSHQPYIMAFYNLKYHTYTFKFGAGAGFHLFKLDNDVNSTNTLTYTASGLSFRAEVIFAPKLSDKLYTYLGGFAFATSTSSLKDENGNLLKGSSTGKEVNLGGYGVGARLGLSFYF